MNSTSFTYIKDVQFKNQEQEEQEIDVLSEEEQKIKDTRSKRDAKDTILFVTKQLKIIKNISDIINHNIKMMEQYLENCNSEITKEELERREEIHAEECEIHDAIIREEHEREELEAHDRLVKETIERDERLAKEELEAHDRLVKETIERDERLAKEELEAHDRLVKETIERDEKLARN